MPLDLAFIDRFTPDKPFDIDVDGFPPPEEVRTVPASEATHVRPRDPVLWLVHEGEARCYPWWIVDNYHMVDDEVRGDPVWVAF